MRGPNGGALVVSAEESDANVWRHKKLQMVNDQKKFTPKMDDKFLIHMVITPGINQ